jgi:hypothetical protein
VIRIRFKVCCPDCGEILVERHAVQLVISSTPGASRYSFTCPECAAWVSKPASPSIVVALVGLVPTRHETAPAELSEPHNGPALDLDDLIDLSRELAATDLLARHAGR